ncbi:PulJ/GspJ family protein [Mucilaginibacter sp. HD30]
MNKRVQAFTIMEVTVAMLLAAIVIAITYTVYTIIIRSYTSYNVKNSNMAVLISLDELLRKDFEKAENINKTERGLSCTNKDKVTTYEFNPNAVIRTSGTTDTFKVKVQAISILFEHAPVSESATNDEGTRVDEMQADLFFDGTKITNGYHKQYSSQNLIQRKSYAIN